MIDRDALITLATLGLTKEQAEVVVDMLLQASEANGSEVEARRASDRARQQRYRERLIQNAAAETGPLVVDGKRDEAEWQRRRAFVFNRDYYKCTYCGTDCRDDPQCDHIVPVVQGGTSNVENLTTACRQCNSSKAGKTVEEWTGR